MRERREKVSIFPEQEKKIYKTQIEEKDSSKEGMEIEEKTIAFIAGPYGTVFEATGMIFEVDFLTQFSRKKYWARISRSIPSMQLVHTVCTVA